MEGHTDFVKAVVCAKLGGRDVLISGGADKKIMVWDLARGARLQTLQDSVTSMLAVQSLAVDPIRSTADALVIVSAGSDPHIRRFTVRQEGWEQLVDALPATPNVERRTLKVHETGVYKAVFDASADSESDLWTASADGTAKCLSRARGFAVEDTIEHGDHVRAVAVTEDWIITAGRDEDIRVWDKLSGMLYCTLHGHYDEVTDLVLLASSHVHGQRLASVGIDGTVRTWPLDRTGLDAAVKEQEKPVANGDGEEEANGDSCGLLTVEEEAELAELMDD